jgi:hypothetical protein
MVHTLHFPLQPVQTQQQLQALLYALATPLTGRMWMVTDVIGTKNMIRQVARCMVICIMEQWDLQGIIAATVPRLTVGVHRQVQNLAVNTLRMEDLLL